MKSALAVVVSLFGTSVLPAQCPDGTPPPCDARRAVAMTLIPRAVAPPSAVERGRRFLVLPFRNVTRQADQDWLVEGSTTMLAEALGKWKGITVVPDEKLYPALKRAGIVPGAVADEDRVRRVSEETGGWTAVTGEVLNTGGKLRITARAWDVPTQKELVRTSTEIPVTGDVRAAFDSVSLKLLRSAGIESVSNDVADATTHNLDAYRSYVSALTHLRRNEVKPALKELQDAVRADSNFAMAWARLAGVTLAVEPGSLFNPQSAAARYSARAVALAPKLKLRDRQLVLANDAIFRAQFTEARKMLEGLVAADSNDAETLNALVGLEMFDPILVNVGGGQRPRGSPQTAARLAKRTVELDPSRTTMFGLLSGLYASAAIPPARPTIAVDRPPSSWQEFMQTAQQREHLRLYYPEYKDSLFLVPVESLTAIPKDTLAAMRKAARAAARLWGERWLATTTGEAVPHLQMSELYAADHDYPAAIRALNTADSIGVQIPAFSAASSRMILLGKSGNYAGAARLADSLVASGYFANPNTLLQATDAAAWAFTLNLLANRGVRAGAVADQAIALYRMLRSGGAPELTGISVVMGNDDPEEDPGITRAVRALQLDSMTAHIVELASVSQLSPWLPMMLVTVAEDAAPNKTRVREVLKAADVLASSGKPALAFQLANNAVASDSTIEPDAAKYAWYRTGAESYNAVKRAAASRFRAGSATISADSAVFEWIVTDSVPFVRDRAETPPGRGEFRWEVTVNAADRFFRFVAAILPKIAVAKPTDVTLAELLSTSSQRYVSVGKVTAGVPGEATVLPNAPVRAESAPGVLRIVVTDRSVLDPILRAKPAEASFRFMPCIRPVGSTAPLECNEAKVSITYR